MDETKQTAETGSEEGGDQRQQQIVDMGSSTIRTERGTIHTLTIVGQIEGHQVLPSSAKTTKYEHVMPLLAAIEESDEVDGLLILLNTVGGDIEAGLAISELISASPPCPWCWGAGTPSACLWRCRPRGPLSPRRRP